MNQLISRYVKVLAPLAVIMAGVGVYFTLNANSPEPEKREDPIRPITVFVEQVQAGAVQLDVSTQGEVRSRVTIDMVAQVGGRVTAVSSEFIEGGTVRPGEALVTIEDTDYRLALNQAESRVAAGRVALELALASADVARRQLRDALNPTDLALQKPQVAEARAMLKAAQADLNQARLNLERTRISLPFTGRMASIYVGPGQYVAPGTALGRAFATDRVEIRLPINNDQLTSLGLPIGYVAAPGEELAVEFSARVAGVEHHWHGKLLRLDASVERDTRLLYALAVVEDPYGENVSQRGMPMAVGLFVQARIRGRELAGALQIPSRALRAGDRVYVVSDKGLLDIRDVVVTHTSPELTVLEAGVVEAGDEVIVSSIRNPIPGIAVQAIEAGNLVSNEDPVNGKG